MLNLKRKYKVQSLEPLGIMIEMWQIYPGVLQGGYMQMHRFRSILSRLGINFIILTYAFLVVLLFAQEVLVGDPLWRQYLLTFLLSHVIFDLMVNVEPLYIAETNETTDYSSEMILVCDRMTFTDRIRQLRRDGLEKAADRVSRTAKVQETSSEPFQSMQWVAGYDIRQKNTGRGWRVMVNERDDYASVARSNHDKPIKRCSNYVAFFQEMDDRRLSRQRREIVLKRLQRYCLRIECDDGSPLMEGLEGRD